MAEIDLLINSIAEYANNTATTMLNSQILGAATSTGVKIWLTNMSKKAPYSYILDGFTDTGGKITNVEEIFNVFKDIIRQKPLVICGVKFNASDIDEIKEIFLSKL